MQESLLEEGLIPMGFNFNQAKQSLNQNNINNLQQGFDDWNSPNFNPNINMNDPEINAQILAKKKREEESAKQQRILNFKQYAINILNECLNSVNNLIRGNKKIGFTKSDANLLSISITNKINEILNSRKTQIDNGIILEKCNEFQQLLILEYKQNIKRYNLENTDTIGFNTENNVVIVNPIWIFEIIKNWLSVNVAHRQEGDRIIWS